MLDGLDGAARAERAELIPWLLERGCHGRADQRRAPRRCCSRRAASSATTACTCPPRGSREARRRARVVRADPAGDGTAQGGGPRRRGVAASRCRGREVHPRLPRGGHRPRRARADHPVAGGRHLTRRRGDAVRRVGSGDASCGKRIGDRAGIGVSRRQAGAAAGTADPGRAAAALRHAIETEAVNATERAEGQHLPGARQVSIAFADLVGFTRLGRLSRRRTSSGWRSGWPT